MTISTEVNIVTLAGNGITQNFTVPFTVPDASSVAVIYFNGTTSTTLSPTQYNVTIPQPATGELWPTSFFVQFPLTGSPIANGTTLTIQRILPLQQNTDLNDQGNFYPQVVEEALDNLEMQIQQISSRTGQIRGTWTTDTVYNYGDTVQDGINGGDTLNYYMCAVTNTSGTWSTDLANGYWVEVISSTAPSVSLPVPIGQGGTGATSAVVALNNLGGISLSANNAFTGINTFTGGSIAVPTASAADSSTKAASTAFVNGTALTLANGTTATTQSPGDNTTKVATTAFVTTAVGGGGAGGGLVLLNPVNAREASSVVFDASLITSAYNKYIIEYDGMYAGTGGESFTIVLSTNNGTSYLGSGYKYVGTYQTPAAGTITGLGYASAGYIDFGLNEFNPSSSSTTPDSGTIKFANPSSSTSCVFFWNSIVGGALIQGMGFNTGTTAINNIKILVQGGSTITGNFHLYGLSGS